MNDHYQCTSGGVIAAGRFHWPAWRRGLTPLTWTNIGSNTPVSLDPKYNAAINPNYPSAAPWAGWEEFTSSFVSWSGGTFDKASQRLLCWFGGHTAYGGNELLSIDLNVDTPVWIIRRQPSGAIGNIGTIDDSAEGSGVYFDGRPRSQHTYGQLVVIDGNLWVMPGGSQFKSGSASRHIYRFNQSVGDWDYTQLADSNVYALPFYGGGCDYDTARGVIWTGGYQNWCKFDPATQVWTRVGYMPGGQSGGYVSVRKCMTNGLIVVGFHTFGWYIYDPDANDWTALPQSGTGPTGVLGQYGFEWDAKNSRFLVWTTGANLYTLTPPVSNPKMNAWNWSTLSADPSNTITPTAAAYGTYGRFFYSQKLNCCGVINAANESVKIFTLE